MKRRDIVLKLPLSGALGTLAGHAAAQQRDSQYPTRAIRMILPTAPGAAVDNGARILAEKLQERLGQPVVVENRPGENTVIGTAAVARAPADGHTLLFVSSSHVLVPLVVPKVPYDPLADFTPIGSLAYTPLVMVANTGLPVNSVQEFIAYAKARPGELNFGSSGVGLTSHMAGEVFCVMTGVHLRHIPYKSGSQVMSELIGGQVQVSWNSVGAVTPFAKAGRLKALAVAAERRVPLLPDVPTFAEAGLKQFRERAWLGLFAPGGTPRPIVERLAREMTQIQQLPEIRQSFEAQGLELSVTNPEQFVQQLVNEMAGLARLMKAARIRMEGS